MAMYDWNHNGKNDMQDKSMIFDRIDMQGAEGHINKMHCVRNKKSIDGYAFIIRFELRV